MTKKIFLKNVATIVACFAVTMIFSACEKESKEKEITNFGFSNPPAVGVIDQSAKSIAVAVPVGTDVTALVY